MRYTDTALATAMLGTKVRLRRALGNMPLQSTIQVRGNFCYSGGALLPFQFKFPLSLSDRNQTQKKGLECAGNMEAPFMFNARQGKHIGVRIRRAANSNRKSILLELCGSKLFKMYFWTKK